MLQKQQHFKGKTTRDFVSRLCRLQMITKSRVQFIARKRRTNLALTVGDTRQMYLSIVLHCAAAVWALVHLEKHTTTSIRFKKYQIKSLKLSMHRQENTSSTIEIYTIFVYCRLRTNDLGYTFHEDCRVSRKSIPRVYHSMRDS